jgi:hypothetical protein
LPLKAGLRMKLKSAFASTKFYMLASSIYGWHHNTVFTLKGEAAEVALHSQAQLVYACVADIYALQLSLSQREKQVSE